jgi:hypothetical protein
VVVSVLAARTTEVLERAAAAGVPARVIGRTGGAAVRIAVGRRILVDLPVTTGEGAWASAIEQVFEEHVA